MVRRSVVSGLVLAVLHLHLWWFYFDQIFKVSPIEVNNFLEGAHTWLRLGGVGANLTRSHCKYSWGKFSHCKYSHCKIFHYKYSWSKFCAQFAERMWIGVSSPQFSPTENSIQTNRNFRFEKAIVLIVNINSFNRLKAIQENVIVSKLNPDTIFLEIKSPQDFLLC